VHGSSSKNAANRSRLSLQKRWYFSSHSFASRIGSARRRQATVRPVFSRVIRPASDSTSRCFITAGSDMSNGFASSLTDALSRALNCATSARRVGSDSAATVRSSGAGE